MFCLLSIHINTREQREVETLECRRLHNFLQSASFDAETHNVGTSPEPLVSSQVAASASQAEQRDASAAAPMVGHVKHALIKSRLFSLMTLAVQDFGRFLVSSL